MMQHIQDWKAARMLGSKHPLAILLLAAAGLCVATPAQAGFSSYTVSATTGGDQTTDLNLTLKVAAFDRTLGTLTGVIFNYVDHTNIQNSTLINLSSSSQDFTITEASVFNLALGNTGLLTNTISQVQTYTSLAPNLSQNFGPYFNLLGSAGPAFYDGTSSGSVFSTFANATTPISLSFTSLTTTTVKGGGGNIQTAIYTTAGATVSVTYQYQPNSNPNVVPEPASMAMTGLGVALVLGVGWVRKRIGTRNGVNARV